MDCQECGRELQEGEKKCPICVEKGGKASSKIILVLVALCIGLGIGVLAKDYFFEDEKKEKEEKEEKEEKKEDLNDEIEDRNGTEIGTPGFSVVNGVLVLNLELSEAKSLESDDLGEIRMYHEEYDQYHERKIVVKIADFGTYEGTFTRGEEFMYTNVAINDNIIETIKARPVAMRIVDDVLHVHYHDSFSICCGQIIAYDKDGNELYNYANVDSFYISNVEFKDNNDILIQGGRTYHGIFYQEDYDLCSKDDWRKMGVSGSDPAGAVFEISYLGDYQFSKPKFQETTVTFDELFEGHNCSG